MRDGEHAALSGGEHGLLLVKVGDSNCHDGTVGRLSVAEPLDVCLAERPLPGERLAANGPRPVAVTFALNNLWQRQRYLGYIVERDHIWQRSNAVRNEFVCRNGS